MSLAKIAVDLDRHSIGSVLIDGIDVAKYATSFRFNAHALQVPEIEIEYIADLDVQAEAEHSHTVALGGYIGHGPSFRAAIEDILAQVVEDEATTPAGEGDGSPQPSPSPAAAAGQALNSTER